MIEATRTAAMAALLLFAACAGSVPQRKPAPISIARTDRGFLFMEGSDSVLVYRDRAGEGPHARPHYVHPLYGLDGEVLTEDAPGDHLHQHGIYWAWHQVYVGEKLAGDGWVQEGISWDVRQVDAMEGEASSALRARVDWVADGRAIVQETTTIRVYPAEAGYRAVDFTIELQPVVDSVRIGGSEDEKGYGGFSARLRLPGDVRFTGRGGIVEPRETAVKAGPWVDVSATFGSAPSGVTILQHPTVPAYPQPWILRSTGSMQNAAWPGRETVPLTSPMTLRYRLVIHRGREVAEESLRFD